MASYASMENRWSDTTAHANSASTVFNLGGQTLVNGQVNPPQVTCLDKLGNLQREILLDLDSLKYCKSAEDCDASRLPPELLGYDPSFLIGRMLEHSKTLLEIVDLFQPAVTTSEILPNGQAPGAIADKSLHDIPTTYLLFSCYVCLIRIYRIIFSSIHDSMETLLCQQNPAPQLFSGLHLAGFSLETRLDLQVLFLVQISEDMLSKLEARFGISEKSTSGKSIVLPDKSTILVAMLADEAAERPQLHEPRGHCEPLKEILVNLKRTIQAHQSK